MATSDSNARIRITAKDETKAAFAGASRSLAQLDQAAGLAASRFLALAPAIAGAFAVQQFRSVVNLLDSLNDISDATGASIEALGKLEGAARRNGATMDDVGSILVKFNGALADAKPDSPLARALQAIGLSASDLRKQDPALALEKVAQALAGYADDGNKARLVQELFGKSVKAAAPFLKDLADGLNQSQKGLDDQSRSAEQFNKHLAELQYSVELYSRSIVGSVLPALNEWIKREAAAREVFGAFDFSGRAGALTDGLLGGNSSEKLQKYRKDLAEVTLKLAELNEANDPRGNRRSAWETEADGLRKYVTFYEKLLGLDGSGGAGAGRGSVNPGAKPTPAIPDLTPGAKTPKSNEIFGPEIPPETLDALKRLEGTDSESIKRLRAELTSLLSIRQAQGGGRIDEAILDLEEQLQALDPAAKAAAKSQAELNALLEQTPTAQMEVFTRRLDLLATALEQTSDPTRAKQLREALAIASQGMENIGRDGTAALDKVSTFAEQASRNIQDALGDTLEQAMSGNFRSIGDLWAQTINRMVAQALAAKLNEALFGKEGKGGGWLDMFIEAAGTYFGGGKAAGGPVDAGTTYLVGEKGPELFTPRTGGTITPNQQLGGGGTTNINVAAGPTRSEVLSAIQLAVRASEAKTEVRLRKAGV